MLAFESNPSFARANEVGAAQPRGPLQGFRLIPGIKIQCQNFAVRFFVVTLPDVLLRAVRASAACCRALRRVPFGKPQIPGKTSAVRFFVVTLPDVLLRAVRASAACCRALRRVPFGKPQIPGKTSAVRFFVVTLPDVLLRAATRSQFMKKPQARQIAAPAGHI